MSRRITSSYVKTIYQRQKEPAWDYTYQPSIQATPKEAPSVSKASLLFNHKLSRRIHLLSGAELKLCIFAFFNHEVVGIQEQRLLTPTDSLHPLWTHPDADRATLKPLKGILKIAEEMGISKIIKTIKVKNKSGVEILLPIPFIGDFLLAIKNAEKISCINWTIKSNQADFSKRELYQYDQFSRKKTNEKIIARFELERRHYESARIPTYFVSEDQFDKHLLNNLRHLYSYHHRGENETQPLDRAELFHHFHGAFLNGIPPIEVIRRFHIKNRFTPEESKSVLYNAIWRKQINVDLFQPVLIDRPLKPAKLDPLIVYKHFFDPMP